MTSWLKVNLLPFFQCFRPHLKVNFSDAPASFNCEMRLKALEKVEVDISFVKFPYIGFDGRYDAYLQESVSIIKCDIKADQALVIMIRKKESIFE